MGAGSTVAVLAGIVHTEGARALFKGLTLNWVKGPVSTSVSFVCFDWANEAMKRSAEAAAAEEAEEEGAEARRPGGTSPAPAWRSSARLPRCRPP